MATTSHHHLCPGEGGSVPRERCALCGLLDEARREALDSLRAKVEGLDSWEPIGTRLIVRDEVLALFEEADQ